MQSPDPWVWFKHGDHVEEGHALCQRYAEETGDRSLVDSSHVRRVADGNGHTMTILLADGPWWRAQMIMHPNEWIGRSWTGIVASMDL